MRKFKVKCTQGREITGFYLGIQLVPQITLEREDLEYKLRQDNQLRILYYDEDGCIWEDWIDGGDQIEFL